MAQLILSFYGEGVTDNRFLPIIIERTAQKIIGIHSRQVVDVLEPIVLKVKEPELSTGAKHILDVAKQAVGCHALIVHADADYATLDRTLNERIYPGFTLAQEADVPVCRNLVPIIPVQMIEAWMLADPDTLKQVIGTKLSNNALNIPPHARHVESIADPKKRIEEVIQTALAQQTRRRRRRITIGMLYEPVARQIAIERLKLVPSYERFWVDLSHELVELNFAIQYCGTK